MCKLGFILSCLMLVACGGGGGDSSSGVDGSKRYVSLSDDEIGLLCEYTIEIARTINCPGGGVVQVGNTTTQAECIASYKGDQTSAPNCALTVAELEACFEAFAAISDEEYCAKTAALPAECAPALTPECVGD